MDNEKEKKRWPEKITLNQLVGGSSPPRLTFKSITVGEHFY